MRKSYENMLVAPGWGSNPSSHKDIALLCVSFQCAGSLSLDGLAFLTSLDNAFDIYCMF
jgi:hypothetical protein